MKKHILFSFIYLIISFSIFGQVPRNLYIGNGPASIIIPSTGVDKKIRFDDKYLDYDWQVGNMQTNDDRMITNVAFMYNVTKDRMELRADVNPEMVDRITFDQKVFIYCKFIEHDMVKSGYFEQLTEGTSALLRRYTIHTVPGKKGAFGYDSFQNISRDYYLKIGDEPAVEIKKNKNDILNVLSDHKEEIEKYIKKNRLNLRKMEDIDQVLNYYSTLVK